MKRSIYQDRGAAEKKACVECASVDQLLVRPSQVPEYLHESEFFKSLNTENDEAFDVPVRYMKANMTVETLQDACDLLGTSRFWGVEISLSAVLQFAVSQSLETIHPSFSVFANEFPALNTLFYILDDNNLPVERMEAAMGSGVIDLVAHMERTVTEFTMKSLASAAAGGHSACLQYALKKPGLGAAVNAQCVYEAAVRHGHLDCLKVLEESHLSIKRIAYFPFWVNNLARLAAAWGHLHCLQYLQSAVFGVHFHYCFTNAAAGGHLPCMQYLVDNCSYPLLQRHGSKALMDAVKADQVDSVRFLYDRGCPLSSDLFNIAACHGSIRSLQFLHENGCVWDQWTCYSAVLNGHLDCLKYALEHSTDAHRANRSGNRAMKAAARHNSIAIMKYLHSHGYALSESVVVEAAVAGALPCLQYCLNNGGECTFSACQYAALGGHLECLQLLHGRGVALVPGVHETQHDREAQDRTTHLVRKVASNGHWECVRYLLAHDYPIPVPGRREVSVFELLEESNQFSLLQILVEKGHEVPLVNFAAHGQLQCLIAAHNCNCKWNAEVCAAAARGGHLECLKYARENGCPWTQKVLYSARAKGHRHIVEYALANNLNVKS